MSETARPLLLEIGCEELPPGVQAELACALRDALVTLLEKAGLLGPGNPEAWYGPRRLAVRLPAVLARAPTRRRLVLGPLLSRAYDPNGQPTAVLTGFARAQGLPPDALGRDGERVVAEKLEDGPRLEAVLAEGLSALLAGLPAARRMRWDETLPPFSRPIRHLLLLHGEDVVPVTLGPLHASRKTSGHRVHHPEPLAVPSADDYPRTLEAAGVRTVRLGDEDDARLALVDLLEREARSLVPAHPDRPLPWRVDHDPELLDENLGLLEHPVAVAGRFDPAYLELPEEVIRVVLRLKQRAFSIRDAHGALVPAFLVFVNLESRDPVRLRHGFERVVRPRLADALFFYRQDRRRRLEEFAAGLPTVTLEHGLGTLADRASRLAEIVAALAPGLGLDPAPLVRAARLAPCDLMTALVGEYPELEGTAGGFYARLDGEDETVARALEEHVLPRRAGDRLPQSPGGALLAIALRLELLCGCFARGVIPSGQSDPMGLRRAANGLLQILLAGPLEAELPALFAAGLRAHGIEEPHRTSVVTSLYNFHLERLASILDARPDLFQAVTASRPASAGDIRDRLAALGGLLARRGEDFARLVAVNKRIVNILRRAPDAPAESRGDPPPEEPPASLALASFVARLEERLPALLRVRDYDAAFLALLDAAAPLERFFGEVLVLDPENGRRAYRLGLLRRLDTLMHALAALEIVHSAPASG